MRLEFNPASHRYFVTDNGETFPVPSVTTILGVVDKPWLIPWAVNNCLSICKGAIVPDTPYAGMYLDQVWEAAKSGYRKVRQEALDTGTQVHEFLEQYLKNPEKPVLPAEETDVRRAVDAAIDWLGKHHVEPVCIERRIYSRKYRYSGTLDKLAYVDGELSLIDWKTAKGIYPEYVLQTAAYLVAYEEETGIKVKKRILIRLGKEDGVFEAHEYGRGDLKRDFKAFKGAQALYQRLQEMKKGGEI